MLLPQNPLSAGLQGTCLMVSVRGTGVRDCRGAGIGFPWKLGSVVKVISRGELPPPQDTVELLQAKVSALDVAVLDQVEARLQSVLGKVNEIAKHKASVEGADTQSKVSVSCPVSVRAGPGVALLPCTHPPPPGPCFLRAPRWPVLSPGAPAV